MAKHHPDLIMCRKQPGIAIGRLCEKCDGKCVICDSYVRPCTLVRVCDECNYGSFQGRCVICGGVGISDGCPKIVNLGSAKTDLFYERKKYGFKKR
uniref:PHD finger-like domain-containing protein 5A n=1 Tax=Solanum lycopersicum TaxID=4081 RepID=A0A3Q7J4E0_SOLLC